MYGSPVFSLVQLILNSSYLIIMFYGIYKISRRKSNRAELEFIKSKYARANVYLVVYVLFVVYFGGVTVLISRIDTADPFIHVFVLKLNVLLLQPFVILGLLYLKLYYLLLEIFAKRQVTNDSKSKSIANGTSHTLILAPHSQQTSVYSIWYKYGNTVLAILEVAFNIGYLVLMFVGIYKWSKRKSNQQQLAYIKAKYATATFYLCLYAFLVVYFGVLTFSISRLDNDEPFTHIFVLKLDILLLQPFALMAFVYIKLYYLLLEIFAKKDVRPGIVNANQILPETLKTADTALLT
ncbi:hypothetical protein HDV01_003747 [Terramyces sp. JEL0728]|nr:hypothetical protein HDV01_003747 [Terramyces sp. JEL0728]